MGNDYDEHIGRLQKYIDASPPLTYDNHKEIYSFIQLKIGSSVQHVPPLDILVYAVSTLLEPTFIRSQIPDLLDLLASIEEYRLKVVSSINSELSWDTFYAGVGPKKYLSADERRSLEKHERTSPATRQIYVNIITELCSVSVYHAWTTSRTVSDTVILLNDFFPALNDSCERSSCRLFLPQLNEEEQEELLATGKSCANFIEQSAAWLIEHATEKTSATKLRLSPEFKTTRCPCSVDEQALLTRIKYYLVYVKEVVRVIESCT